MKTLRLSILAVLCALATPSVRAEAPPAYSLVKPADVLAWKDGSYQLDGGKFAEIGWNKFDLFWELWEELSAGRALTPDNTMLMKQDQALSEISRMGFRTIRIFGAPFGGADFHTDPELRKRYYQAMDTCMDLLERHHIGAVLCLGSGQFTSRTLAFDGKKKWTFSGEQERELIGDASSESRKMLYAYLEDVIPRYRDRKGIVMWDISNELTNNVDIKPDTKEFGGERKATLRQLAQFYTDVAEKIRSLDPLRLVSTGGSHLRPSAWNQLENHSWKLDTYEEHLKAFELIFGVPKVDVIDIHFYAFPQRGYALADKTLQLREYVELVQGKLGKPLIFGEVGPLPKLKSDEKTWKAEPGWFESYEDKEIAAKWFRVVANEIIDSGAQISYWWAYSSDRRKDQNIPDRMDVSVGRNPELVNIVVEANRALKEKHGVSLEGMPQRLNSDIWPIHKDDR